MMLSILSIKIKMAFMNENIQWIMKETKNMIHIGKKHKSDNEAK